MISYLYFQRQEENVERSALGSNFTVFINQTDAAMKGRQWKYDANMQEQCLLQFLNDEETKNDPWIFE